MATLFSVRGALSSLFFVIPPPPGGVRVRGWVRVGVDLGVGMGVVVVGSTHVAFCVL